MKPSESSIVVRVTDQFLNESETLEFARDPGHGARNFFFGTVREINHGRTVVAVEYDAFIPLAEKTFHSIGTEALKQWGPDLKISIRHRIGRLVIGEISVAIGVSSRHRDEAYQASRYIIEEIKHRSPIWKKEYYENGETEWLKGHSLCQHSVRS